MTAEQATRPDQRIAVVVLGMHRSGTSALAGMLARLGCDVPRDLLEAAPMNAKGFYESGGISQMNDELMQSAGSSWFTWQPFSDSWFRAPQAQAGRTRAMAQLEAVYGDAAFPVIKDPRMCMLVPFWETVLAAAGYAPRYLHTHRHPLEVAQSLDHWAGYDQGYGQLLWLRYVLTAEASTRGQVRHFTSYTRLMQDWRAVARNAGESLDLVWPRQSDRAAAEIDDFLDRDLSHMQARDDHASDRQRLAPWVATTFAILERWSAQGEDAADHATLDGIRAAFDVATPAFSAAVETGRTDTLALRTRIRDERDQAAERDALARRLAQAEAARDAVAAERDALKTAMAAERDALRDERQALLRDLRNRHQQALQATRDQLTTALRLSNTHADALVSDARKQRDAAERKLRAMTVSTSWRLTAPLRGVVLGLRRVTGRG